MLTLVTGNAGKRRTFEELLGTAISVVDLDTTELQLVDVAAIARHKALEAFNTLKRPVVVEDSGLFVPSLNGWPGAFTKPFITAVGVEGLLRLSGEVPAAFHSAVAYADADRLEVFTGVARSGRLVMPGDAVLPATAWSPLWRVFVPSGHTCVMAELSDEERHAGRPVDYPMVRFAAWYSALNA